MYWMQMCIEAEWIGIRIIVVNDLDGWEVLRREASIHSTSLVTPLAPDERQVHGKGENGKKNWCWITTNRNAATRRNGNAMRGQQLLQTISKWSDGDGGNHPHFKRRRRGRDERWISCLSRERTIAMRAGHDDEEMCCCRNGRVMMWDERSEIFCVKCRQKISADAWCFGRVTRDWIRLVSSLKH